MAQDKTESVGLEKRRGGCREYWVGRMGNTSDSLIKGLKKGGTHNAVNGTRLPAREDLNQIKSK